jgi:serine/threonine protein kinase
MPSKPKSKPKYDFRTCLKKSEVLKSDVLEKWLADHPDSTPTDDASKLVRENLLTEWQAKYLLSGRYRLHLGNFQLLRRVRRDDFGDRFVALHPQLGRTVQVQVLPVELTDNDIQRSEFLKQAGLAGELDHPNLAHVFDIDKQQGRYYLVTEHSEGRSLAELSETSPSPATIARIVRDSISGITYAHSHSFVHGNLSMDNVLIDEDGAVKVTQLGLSPLAEKSTKSAKENITPEQSDLLGIVRIGRRLLNRAEASSQTRELGEVLFKLNTKNESAFEEALIELDAWIEQEEGGSDTNLVTDESQTEPSAPVKTSSDEIERLANNARLTKGQKTKRRRNDAARNLGLQYYLIPAGMLALLTLVIGAAGYFGYQALFAPNQTAIKIKSSPKRSETPVRKKDEPVVADSTKAPDDSNDFAARLLPDRSGAWKSPPISNRSEPAPGKSDVDTSLKPDSADEGNNAAQGERITIGAEKLVAPNSTDSPKANSDSFPKVDPNRFDLSNADTGSDFLSTETVSNRTVSDDEPATIQPQTSHSPEPNDAVGPFDGFPSSVDLPPTDSLDEAVLAAIKKPSIHLLGMELFSPEGVGKGRTTFALQRDETNKQKWSLIAKKTPKSNGDQTGQFTFDKTSGKIAFRWSAQAADSKIANYVRNCRVKITLADESRTLSLRTPRPLPNLKLTREQPFAQLDSALEWLPDPELITVELLPSKTAGLPKTWLEPAIVQPGMPSAIHFHEAVSNRFMWLQLGTEIRNQASFDLKLLLKHADGTVQPITRSGDLKKLAELLVDAARAAEQKYFANMDVVAPQGQKTKFKDYVARLKSTAKKTQRQSEIAAENIAIIENFYDRVIPLRVMFRADDHEVVLVDTSPAVEDDETDQ